MRKKTKTATFHPDEEEDYPKMMEMLLVWSAPPQKLTIEDVSPGVSKKTMETLLHLVRKKKTLLVRSASPQKSTIKDVSPGVSKKMTGMSLVCLVRMKKRRRLPLAEWGDAIVFGLNEEEDYHWSLLCSIRMKKRRKWPLLCSLQMKKITVGI
uniref:Uncharacterized protein n=1 Tax=Nelumbo nucifera TaxID=4432 RepID=A0A822YXI9_NELNU|nr:TPA_asm: hypothetical protein HUJ06_013106 [Nelumbo nucifera]